MARATIHASPASEGAARAPSLKRRIAPDDGVAGDVPAMHLLDPDPTGRLAGQYTRSTWRRLRLRTLVTLGVLAVATALLGRSFGLHDARFIASEIALLVTIFVTLRYVLPLVARRDMGAAGEE